MFYRRSRPGEDPWLWEKVWIFTAGAVAAMLGMLLDNAWVMAGAGILLAAGVLLRFVPRGGEDSRAETAEPPDPADPAERDPRGDPMGGDE